MGRLAILGTLSIIGAIFLHRKGAGREYVTAGILAVATTVASLVYSRRRPGSLLPYWFLLVTDGLLLGIMVHYGGGISGPFVLVFYFHVLAAGMLMGTRAGLVAAGLDVLILLASGYLVSSGHYITTGSVLLNSLMAAGNRTLSFEYVLLRVCMEAALLLTIGLVSGYLAENLNTESGKLQKVLQNLAETRARSRRILESLSDGVVVVAGDGRPISINQAAIDLLGLRSDWEHGISETEVASCLSNFLSDDNFPSTVELVLGERIVECRLGRFQGEEGMTSGAMAVMTDVTEARNLRGALEERDRLSFIGRLSATMAHEIRNPLASISGAAQMLSKGGLDPEKTDRMTGLIVRQTRRVSELIEGYLELSREAKDFLMEPVSLSGIAADTVEEIRHGMGKNASVEFTSSQPCTVMGNGARLGQMVSNLVRNAVEAVSGDEEGRVAVTVEESGEGSVLLTVSDNGPGIDIDLEDKIWNPFFTTRLEGTGLGLYVSKKIAEDHRGTIEIRRPGSRGTAMVVGIPSLADVEQH